MDSGIDTTCYTLIPDKCEDELGYIALGTVVKSQTFAMLELLSRRDCLKELEMNKKNYFRRM